MFWRYALFLIALWTVGLTSALASEDKLHPKHIEWGFDGNFGKFDRQAIQRGFQVYKEVCAACHSLKRIAFRDLADIGFSEAEIKSLAASYSVADGPNQEGEMFERAGRPADYFLGPYANEQAARAANNNALPPDLSLIIKAREDGANYVYSLLTGYQEPPAGFEVGENMYYNPYFAGGGSQLAMTPPLTQEGQVQYADGTQPTVDQMAQDVVNFLQWAAEPEMEKRKGMGVKVILFLAVFTFLFMLWKRKLWRDVK